MKMPLRFAATLLVALLALATAQAGTDNKKPAKSDPVTVVNTPLPVRDAGIAKPFEGHCDGFFTANFSSSESCTIAVPAGNQLVVQAVSALANIDPGLVALSFDLQQSKSGGASGGHRFPMRFLGPVNFTPGAHDLDAFAAAQSFTWYFDPTATGVVCYMNLSDVHTSNRANIFSCTVTGYLVPQ
ncbi:MAG TPA: hypothetical protein VMI74_09625 [Burkholderiales bacterium]|nr:hypothetical protein [Burkholderiales bacterium]